jgi:hypothetical protein
MPRCDICNYDTLRMDNLIRHYNTQKHIEKEENKNYCNICRRSYSSVASYKKHKNKYHNDTENNKLKTIIIESNKELTNNIKGEMKEVKGEMKEVKGEMKEVKGEIKEEMKEVKEKIEESNNNVKKALNKASSLIAYLMKHHASTPPLKRLNKTDTIKLLRSTYCYPEKKNDYSLQVEIIRQIKNGTFIKKLSKIILNILNHNQPENQPIYNTDCNRNHYVIKTPSKWNEDKAGVKFSSYIVTPLLQYIREIISDYRINIEKNIQSESESYNQTINDSYSDALKVELDLMYEAPLNDILTKLSPYLRYFDEELDEFDSFEQLQQIQKDLPKIMSDDDDDDDDDVDVDVDDDGVGDDKVYDIFNIDEFTKYDYINYKKLNKRII